MSTPTTATATLPPHYRHHHHPTHHYPPYPNLPTASSSYRAVAGVASNPIIPTTTSTASTATVSNQHQGSSTSSYTTSQLYSASSQTLLPCPNGVAASIATTRPTKDSTRTNSTPRLESYKASMPPSTASTTQTFSDGQPRKRRRSKEPDWNTFYKNGLPKEIIVIDDTPEPEKDRSAATSSLKHANNDATRNPPKRRRKDDVARNDDAHSSRVNDSYQQTSISGSISTDRTTSAHNTTAATSLGSLSSNGQYDYESRQVGQKRKRTRQQIAQEAKRREVEVLAETFVSYRPPQKPVKKAGDVTVRSVNDRSDQRHQRVDDDDGHYIVVPDADLTPQYQMIKLLGQGTFGKVVQARDRKRSKLVAIKIIRAVQKYRDASRIELRVLQTLKANDEENRNRCIHLRDCFDFRGHICIVMDLLGSSVFDFLKSNNFVPFPNSQIQSFARQLFTSVAFLHDLNLIHTDLKPENILLCDSAYQTFTYNRRIPSSSAGVNRQATQRKVLLDTEIRLIDFGSATFQDEYHSSVVSTRHYRAPEIILGLGWSFPCDIWSIGCILVEFFTGDALFQTHDNLEHLAMMENVCDCRIDNHLVQTVNKMATRSTGNAASKYFKRLKLDYPTAETTRASRRFVKNMKRLSDIIPASSPFLRSFLDLLQRIFVYDPAKRITARQALEHEWFREPAIPDDGTEAAKIRLERMRDHEFPATRGVAVA
ncbi:kinase-like domain-containing protein [Annulohypoxylon bovei var. microspora]|nr:kinase-like domain-containing protein [Annulohypoxylon bovei var. microspora]